MIKGETLEMSLTDADAVSVEFRFGGPQTRTVNATKSGTTFSVAADTAAWTAGAYRWQAWGTYAENVKRVIASATIDIEDALGVGDIRSTARQIVEKIEAMIAGNAGEGVRRYKINNRELERYSVAELLQLLSYWKAQVRIEERKAAGKSALGPRIAVRF